MSFFFLVKMVSDLSLFFMVATALLSGTNCDTRSLLPLIVISASGTLGFYLQQKKDSMRFAALLVLPLAFVGQPLNVWSIPLLLAACLYGVLIVGQRRFSLSYEERLLVFSIGMKLLLVCLFLLVAFWPEAPVITAFSRYLLCFVISTLLLTQTLRHSSQILSQHRFQLMAASYAVLAVAAAVFFSSKLFFQFLLLVYQWVLVPLILVLATVIGLFFWLLFSLLPNKEYTGNAFLDILGSVTDLINIVPSLGKLPSIDPSVIQAVKIAWGVLIFVVVFLFCRRILRRRRHRRHVKAVESRAPITVHRVFRSTEEPLDDQLPRDPREAVRFYYRNFMRMCRSIGILIPSWATSLELERQARQIFPFHQRQLLSDTRRIYLRARYSDHPVGPEDVSSIRDNCEQLLREGRDIENR